MILEEVPVTKDIDGVEYPIHSEIEIKIARSTIEALA